MVSERTRRVVTYVRVSTEEQRERQTIQNQLDILHARLALTPDVELVEIYADDGVSGTIPLARRPAGSRLVDDSKRQRFDEVWVVRADRLGRDAADMLMIWKLFKELQVKLVGVEQSIESYLAFGFQALIAEDERERFMARSAAGMDRAARQGRYTGGICPLGYRVKGKKAKSRLVPSKVALWGNWSEADVVGHIYRWLAIEGRSCRWIADELNSRGVPTVYQRDGRGIRGRRTQGKWRAGRIRNLVVNPIYKGELCYGRRSGRREGREVIRSRVEALVSEEMWETAQETLGANRIMPKNTERTYLLRSIIFCGICGLRYCGSFNKRSIWYRCNGRLTDRGPLEGRCQNKMVKGEDLERLVWADIERFLRDPGDLLDELVSERNGEAAAAVVEAERTTLEVGLKGLADERDLTLDLYTRRHISADELEERLQRIAAAQDELSARLATLEPKEDRQPDDFLSADLLAELRGALDQGLDDSQRQQIVSQLVRRITVNLSANDGRPCLVIMIEYRFVVVNNQSDRGSSPPPS